VGAGSWPEPGRVAPVSGAVAGVAAALVGEDANLQVSRLGPSSRLAMAREDAVNLRVSGLNSVRVSGKCLHQERPGL
jgi:hypothetical protein